MALELITQMQAREEKVLLQDSRGDELREKVLRRCKYETGPVFFTWREGEGRGEKKT